MKKKKYLVTLTFAGIFGFELGYIGTELYNLFLTPKLVEKDKQTYGEIYDLMLKTKSGRVLTLKDYKKPITVKIGDFSDKEKEQIIESITRIDNISSNINYKILNSSDKSVSANISILKENKLKSETALAITHYRYNNNAKIVYPLTISIKQSFAEKFNEDISDDSERQLLSHVVKHELMHTLGFKDLYEPKEFYESIMWNTINNYQKVNDLTQRDIDCIKKIYDEGLVEASYPTKIIVYNEESFKKESEEEQVALNK